jgi:uncharacterized Ntn-hydrolase superfamily protein
MTYSIVARDPATGEFGVAVQSKFLAVGAVVPWAQAGVGAIATQAFVNTNYGPEGLELLYAGLSTEEVLQQLIESDEKHAERQIGIIGVNGKPVTYTGDNCFDWAGGYTGEHYACQGNILVGQETVMAMARSFEETSGSLCDRLITALAAGQQAGGDSRGQQSAALLVVKERGGYGGLSDRFIDLRVDDHPTPIDELKRILQLHKLYFFRPKPEDVLPIDEVLTAEIQYLLKATGDYNGPVTATYDSTTRRAFRKFTGRENLEERWFEDAHVDRVVLDYLRKSTKH